MEYKHSNITELIIKAFFNVYNKLGYGFLEKVYENAMYIELQNLDLLVEQQQRIKVYYNDEIVGDYITDLVVENTVIIELKAVEEITAVHEVQLVNYLRATELEVGLLLNFGKVPKFKRKIFDNENKTNNSIIN